MKHSDGKVRVPPQKNTSILQYIYLYSYRLLCCCPPLNCKQQYLSGLILNWVRQMLSAELPFCHEVSIFNFRPLKPDVRARLHHRSLYHSHQPSVYLPHLNTQRKPVTHNEMFKCKKNWHTTTSCNKSPQNLWIGCCTELKKSCAKLFYHVSHVLNSLVMLIAETEVLL